MKKVIYVMAVASLMLSSCSNDEPEVNNGRAIEFRPGISRATSYTSGTIDKFYAYAFVGSDAYFSKVEFTEGSNSTFGSTTPYYWPGDGKTVDFKAYAPVDLSGTIDVTAAGQTLAGFAVNKDIAKQQDFIFGTGSGNKASNEGSGVGLDFNHMLSQIEVKAVTNNDTYTFSISGVRIAQIQNKGDYDSSKTPVWSVATGSAAEIYESTFAAKTLEKGADPVSVMGTNGNAILLPQTLTAWQPNPVAAATASTATTGAYISVKLTVTAANGNVQIFPFEKDGKKSEWASVPVSGTWQAGYKYIYVLDFTKGAGRVDPNDPVDPDKPIFGEPIKFTVNEIPWTDGGTTTLEMDK